MQHSLYKIAATVLVAAAAATSAHADTVRVTTTGTVAARSGTLNGDFSSVAVNQAVTLSFLVDSNAFTSATAARGGYAIDMSSMSFTIGSAALTVKNTTAGNTGFFVMRNNDPGVDGIVLSDGSAAGSGSFLVTAAGTTDAFRLAYSVSWTAANSQWNNLDILAAQGTHGTTGLNSFDWSLTRTSGAGSVSMNFNNVTISAVPEPSTMLSMSLGALALLGVAYRRQRK